MVDFTAIRAQFPILDQQIHGHPLVYLDSAATSQKPQCVIDAESEFYRTINAGVHRGAHELAARSTMAFEDARAKVARLVGANAEEGNEEIVVTAGATAGLNLLATAFGNASLGRGGEAAKRFALKPGDEIVVSKAEHHSVLLPFQELAYHTGATLKWFDLTEDGLTHLESFKGFFPIARKELGGQIDILVNNAGISLHEGNMMNVTVEGFSSQIMTNLTGPYFLAQEFLRQYENQIEKSNASIIFMASEKGLFPDELPYGLTKAAIVSLTQGMARRWVTKGIRVNALAPGVTASDMTGYKRDNLYCENNCSRRAYLPEEVAEVAVFLASDTSRCITGQVLTTNMGNHLRCDW